MTRGCISHCDAHLKMQSDPQTTRSLRDRTLLVFYSPAFRLSVEQRQRALA